MSRRDRVPVNGSGYPTRSRHVAYYCVGYDRYACYSSRSSWPDTATGSVCSIASDSTGVATKAAEVPVTPGTHEDWLSVGVVTPALHYLKDSVLVDPVYQSVAIIDSPGPKS